MAIRYDSIVPWGRSYEEYIDMFRLTGEDTDKSMLGCGDGPASFNSIMNKRGKRVVSLDPIYQFSESGIAKRIEDTYENVLNQTRQNTDRFIWTTIKNIEDLAERRMKAMREFLADYEKGKAEGRYVFGELPVLPFENDEFDLVISSHLLFFYTDNLTIDFHYASIDEMLRISREVRIFPLVDLNAERSPYVDKVVSRYRDLDCITEEIKVGYEFQKGGNQMLRIVKQA